MKLQLRLFVEVANEEQALQYVNKIFEEVASGIIKKKMKLVEKYWKMTGGFVVHYELLVEHKVLAYLQEKISDSWMVLGAQGEELIASRNSENCSYMSDKIVMANIVIE